MLAVINGKISNSEDQPILSTDISQMKGGGVILSRERPENGEKRRRDVKRPIFPTPSWDNSVASRSVLQIEC